MGVCTSDTKSGFFDFHSEVATDHVWMIGDIIFAHGSDDDEEDVCGLAPLAETSTAVIDDDDDDDEDEDGCEFLVFPHCVQLLLD